MALSSSLLCTILVASLSLIHAVQVDTVYGTVEGQTFFLEDSYHEGIGINVFYGIPFARPPVGDLRFALPEEPDPWDDVLVADTLGYRCPQGGEYSEDCLHLNLVAPADPSGAPYAVMVWLYGGAYQSGYNNLYPAHFLAAHDVVVVIPNYRVNVFGFAYSGDENIPGNMGLWDQRLALQFVQENIAAFGGDPDRVTIFGQSAGGSSVGHQVVSPASEGLFHKAIPQSGSELGDRSLNGPDHEPENYIAQVADDLDCPTWDTALMTACLRNRTAEEVRTASWSCKEGYHCMGMAPVVDGPGGFLPDMPASLREAEQFSQVPYMTGICRHDGFSFCIGLGNEMLLGGPNRTEFQTVIRRTVDYFVPRGLTEKEADDINQAIDFYYTPWPHINNRADNRHAICEAMTDGRYGHPGDLSAKHQSQYAPVYYYVFDYEAENLHDFIPQWWGAAHSVELPFVFGNPFLRHNPEIRESCQIEDSYEFTEQDDVWSYFIMTLWTNFAKYGNPTPEPVEQPGQGDPVIWTEFNTETYNYVRFAEEEVAVEADYRQREYAFWREYIRYLGPSDDDDDRLEGSSVL